MIITEPTNRIKELNEIYQNSEAHKNGWHHGRVQREVLLYNRGFMQSKAKSGLIRKAEAEAYMLRNLAPIIKDGELIVGQPDYSPFTCAEKAEWDMMERELKGSPKISSIGGHMSVYFPKLLQMGIDGLLKEIEGYREKIDLTSVEDVEKEEFYMCVETELKAVLKSAENYAIHAEKLSEKAEKERKIELQMIARNLRQVPKYPARNFWEAVQCIHFFNYSLHNYFLYGRIDQYLYPYLKSDLENNTITLEKAQELLDCLFLLPAAYSDNFSSSGATVGGRTPNGEIVENEITKMVLMTCYHCKDTNNFIGLGVNEKTNREMLRFATELVAKTTQPILFNDEKMTESLNRYGYALEDARQWVNTGIITTCFGKCSSYSQGLNRSMIPPLQKALERVPETYEELKKIYREELHKTVKEAVQTQNYVMMERARQGFEVFRISALVDGCLESGKNIDQGGNKYVFSQPNFAGFANVIDSFAVLKHFVYDMKKYTILEILEALDADYLGYDELFEEINSLPHYGSNDKLTNHIAQEIAEILKDACKGVKNIFGKDVLPGVYTWNYHIKEGEKTKATPDGRHAKEILSTGIYPAVGRESNGAEASLLSATSWDQTLIPITPIYYTVFTPEKYGGPNLEELTDFVEKYIRNGGKMLRFSISSIDEIKSLVKDETTKSEEMITIAQFSMPVYKAKETELIQEFLAHDEHRTI